MAMGWWNAHVYVGDAKVGLGWRVADGGPHKDDYHTLITVTYPEQTSASRQKLAGNETVKLNASPNLSCGANGIAVIVTYRVSRIAADASGSRVEIKIAKVSGMKAPQVTNQIWAVDAGQIDEDITMNLVIPGSC